MLKRQRETELLNSITGEHPYDTYIWLLLHGMELLARTSVDVQRGKVKAFSVDSVRGNSPECSVSLSLRLS